MAIWIIMVIEIMSYTLAGNGQCASGTNTVPVCTNSTDSYTQMYIPVNGGIAGGCICDVTLVETPSSGNERINVSNVEGVKECGYKVVNYNTTNNDSWTCSNNEIVYYSLSSNESFQLTFTRDSTPEPSSTGFCLYLTTTINNIITNNTFAITCWRNNTTPDSTSTTLTPQTETEEETTPTSQEETTPTSTITTSQDETTPTTTITTSQKETTTTTTITTSQEETTTITTSQEETTPTNTMTPSQNVSVSSSTTAQPTNPTTTQLTNPTTRSPNVTTSKQKPAPTSSVTTPQTSGVTQSSVTEKVTDAAIIGGGAAGASLLLIIIIVIIVCLMKRRKNNQYHKPSTRTNGDTGYEDVHPDEPIMMENNGDSQRAQGRPNSNNADEMIYLENDLYVSADSFPDNSTQTSRSPSSPDYTDIDDIPGRKPDKAQTIPPTDVSVDKNPNVNNVYAVVNKKPKTEGTDGETNYYKDENQPHIFSVGQTPGSNNIYAVVNKLPKKEKTDNSGGEPNHQASAHNGENPHEIFSVSETPNPNNAYAVVNKKPKVTEKPSKPETPPKPGKPPKPERAVKPRVPSKPTTKL